MACGKPVIASFASGHTDVVNDKNALLLTHMREWVLTGPDRTVFARWQDPPLDELVAKIEYAYHHRRDIKRLGQTAGEDMKRFTWKHTAERLLGMLGITSRNIVTRQVGAL